MAGAIAWFDDLDQTDTAWAGGKGADLGERAGAGLTVPAGDLATAWTTLDVLAGPGGGFAGLLEGHGLELLSSFEVTNTCMGYLLACSDCQRERACFQPGLALLESEAQKPTMSADLIIAMQRGCAGPERTVLVKPRGKLGHKLPTDLVLASGYMSMNQGTSKSSPIGRPSAWPTSTVSVDAVINRPRGQGACRVGR